MGGTASLGLVRDGTQSVRTCVPTLRVGTRGVELRATMIAEPSQSLSDLLRRARAGDVRELDRLFAACRNYLCVVAQSHVEGRLRTKADASHLVQQTLLDAYRDLAQFRGGTDQQW